MPVLSRWAVPFLAATWLAALVLGLFAPLAARAQQTGELRRIGVLMGQADEPPGQARIAAFRRGLQTLGWVEGRNVRIDIRWAPPSDAPAMQRFAKELVALQPDLIVSHTTPTTVALLQHTRTIPIVFAVVADPIGSGFVASIPRPGGNVTGFTNIEPTMAGKSLELLNEVAPRVSRVAFLFTRRRRPMPIITWAPSRPPRPRLPWKQFPPLFATPQSSNPPLQHRHARRTAASSR